MSAAPPPDMRHALSVAKTHIEHMAAWISRTNASETPIYGYSFEALGEDKWIIDQALAMQPAPSPQGRGHQHTAIMEAIRADVMRQQPRAFSEDNDGELLIPRTTPDRTIYVKLDISALAEAVLALSAPPAPGGSPEEMRDLVWSWLKAPEATRIAIRFNWGDATHLGAFLSAALASQPHPAGGTAEREAIARLIDPEAWEPMECVVGVRRSLMAADRILAAQPAAAAPAIHSPACQCVQSGDGPEGCGLCNETGARP